MAWIATNIYVRTDDRDAVARALRAALDDPALATNREGILDPPEPVLVTPPVDGWVAAAGLKGWVRDVVAAGRRVSAELGARAVACDLVGCCLRVDLALCEGGEVVRRLSSPGETADGAMPHYEDVEQRAFEALGDAGVPPRLMAVGERPLGAADPEDAGEGLRIGATAEEAQAKEPPTDPDAPRRTFGPCHVSLAAPCRSEAPVIAGDVSDAFGVQIFEHRFLTGRPTPAAVDRVIAVEEACLARARRTHPDAEVSLIVTYHVPEEQQRLDALLAARGRHTVPQPRRHGPPWWQFWRHIGRRG